MTNSDLMSEGMIQADGELTEKQKRILLAATEMFAEKGYAATSTNEIAKKAGVAEGTIFRHYKTKKALLLSILTPMMLKMIGPLIIADLNKVLDQEFEQFDEFLYAMIKNRQDFFGKNKQIIQVFIQEIPFQHELREQFIEHVGLKVFSRFVQIVEYYQEKGQIIEMPASTVVRLIASTLVGFFATKYVLASKNVWDDEVEIERMIQYIMKGLQTGN